METRLTSGEGLLRATGRGHQEKESPYRGKTVKLQCGYYLLDPWDVEVERLAPSWAILNVADILEVSTQSGSFLGQVCNIRGLLVLLDLSFVKGWGNQGRRR